MKNIRPRPDGEGRRRLREYVIRLKRDGSLHYLVKRLPKDEVTIEIVSKDPNLRGKLADLTGGEYEYVSSRYELGVSKGDEPELTPN